MSRFTFESTKIAGLYQITAFCTEDIRGCFIKDYSQEVFEQHKITHNLKEVFYTVSRKGVIRALHFQRTKQQPKLVRCISGHIYDVVVDLRRDQPTYREWLGFDLKGNSCQELLVPVGCAHGYLVLEDSIVSYKCSEKFFSEFDDGILWNDSDLAINWPLSLVGGAENIILSDKDQHLQTFAEFTTHYGSL